MRHPEDGIMDACKTSHLVNILRCSVDVPVLQVVEDGVVEQNSILTTERRGGGESKLQREYCYCCSDGNRVL